jgi:hypothetical protein
VLEENSVLGKVRKEDTKLPVILTFCLRAAISISGDNASCRPIVPEMLQTN